jgi:kumamolisin
MVLGLAVAACAPPPSSGSTSAPLAAHQPARVLAAHTVGHVDRDEEIDLVLGLRLRDREGLLRLAARQADPRSGDFRRWLAPSGFADAFAIPAADYDAIVELLAREGLTITRRLSGRAAISVRGRAADIERVLGTELLLWEDQRPGGARFRAPSSQLRLPLELAGWVDTIVGLDDADAWMSHRRTGLPGGADPHTLPNGSADPADLRTLYNAVAAKHPGTMQPLLGAGETVAILGTGYAPGDTDVKNFITRFSLPTSQAAQYVRVALGGQNRDPDLLARVEYGENVLDIDMVLAMAPLANVVHVLTASNAPGLFSDGIAFIVDQVPQAHAVSVSYGSCERVSVYEVLQMNTFFLQAKTQGQAWFIASGDNGTDGCRDGSADAVPSVDWPASSPYVFGVGGTQLNSGVEVTWGPGGGGQSEIFAKPTWQEGVGPLPGDGVRQVPDVAALSGSPGVSTVFGNSVEASFGTSAAAPIWAGIWALLVESRDHVGLTDYHERIYQLGKTGSSGFKDITAGSNSDGTTPGFPALPGYDLATGWGAPNVADLVGGVQ